MELIERDHGFAAILAMLRGYAEGHGTAELLHEVLGMPPEAFDTAFNEFVAARFRASLDGLFGLPGADPEERRQATYPELLQQAEAAVEAGETARAHDLLWRALELFPDHAGPDSAYRRLAALEARGGNRRAAAALLEASLAIDADDLAAHLELAALYLEDGNDGKAIDLLERALLVQPFDAAVHRELAGLYEARDAWEPALAARSAVLALRPADMAGARFHLARALHRAGQPDAARRELLRTLEAAPLYDEALELLLAVRETLAPAATESTTEPAAAQ
jgi:tetratricopeptide (TPR) repeat protein